METRTDTLPTKERVTQPTRILMAVSQSTIKGYPHASISSTRAFEFILKKIIRSDPSHFKVVLLHVQDPCGVDKSHERGLQMLSYFSKRCHDYGVESEYWIKDGRPERVIGNEVRRLRPDLLVVGSRGLGWFRRIFVGSVSEACTGIVECPVLIVKRRREDTPDDSADD